jgi:chromosome segregation ATPase
MDIFDPNSDKKKLLKEIEMEQHERDALKKAYEELEEIDQEIIDEHKVIEMLDEKIVFCYEKLYEVLEKLMELKDQGIVEPTKLMEAETIHNEITAVADQLKKYLDRIEHDAALEKKGIALLEKHFTKIISEMKKNDQAITKFKEHMQNQ